MRRCWAYKFILQYVGKNSIKQGKSDDLEEQQTSYTCQLNKTHT